MRNLLACKKINNRLLSLIVVCFICLLCALSFNYNVANAAKHQETDCEVEARAYVNRMIEVIRNTHAIVGYKTVTRSDTNQEEFQVLLKKNRITEQEIVLSTRVAYELCNGEKPQYGVYSKVNYNVVDYLKYRMQMFWNYSAWGSIADSDLDHKAILKAVYFEHNLF